MLRILENVEPFRTMFFQIVDTNKARGLWGQDKTAVMLRVCLWQSFALTKAPDVDAPIPRTILRDHVLEFLRGLLNPAGYCPHDHTPVLPLGAGTNVGFCAADHCWSLGSLLLIRKTELAIPRPIVALPEEIRT